MRSIRLSVVLAVLAIAPAAAAGPDSAEAQRLFDEARAYAERGRWSEACPRLAESFRLEPNMTTEFRLADCYERTGRIASAWEHYVGAARSASRSGEAAKEKFASERAAKLAPRVDKIVIVPPADTTELSIERDGRTLTAEQWNEPLPLDPGEHTVHAWAPGKASFDVVFTTSGTGELHRVEVPTLEPAIPWRLDTNAKVTTPPAPTAQPQPLPESPKPQGTSWHPLGWGLGGVGLLAIGVGGALYVSQVARTEPCSGSSCVPGVSLMAGGALVLVAGALVLLATDH